MQLSAFYRAVAVLLVVACCLSFAGHSHADPTPVPPSGPYRLLGGPFTVSGAP